MKIYHKYAHILCTAIFFSLSAGGLSAQAQTCEDNPAALTILDCDDLRSAVLYSVRHKRQGVTLPVNINHALHSKQTRRANAIYKDFLHWTATRDRVTIGNLLTSSQRAQFDPNSYEAEGYTVAWLNVPSVNAGAYYDEFWAQRSGQVVITRRPVGANQTALRD